MALNRCAVALISLLLAATATCDNCTIQNADHLTRCIVRYKDPEPENLLCYAHGQVKNPVYIQDPSCTATISSYLCRDLCVAHKQCKSYQYSFFGGCFLYAKNLREMQFKKRIHHYNHYSYFNSRDCFDVQCWKGNAVQNPSFELWDDNHKELYWATNSSNFLLQLPDGTAQGYDDPDCVSYGPVGQRSIESAGGPASVFQSVTVKPNTLYMLSAYVGYELYLGYGGSPSGYQPITIKATLDGASVIPEQLIATKDTALSQSNFRGTDGNGYRQINGTVMTGSNTTQLLMFTFDCVADKNSTAAQGLLDLITLVPVDTSS